MSMKEHLRAAFVGVFRHVRGIIGWVPPEGVFKHLHFVGPFEVAMPNGQTIRMYSQGNRVENEIAWRGWDGHEQVERRCWAKMVSMGGDILDVGANTATYAITAKCISPSSRVFAFEPLKRVAALARQNIETSGCDITVVCAAVGRQSGELPIYDPGGNNAYSASLNPDFLEGSKRSYSVPVISIDEFCDEHGLDPESIKLDVEGYETEAIYGARRVLARQKAMIICEWSQAAHTRDEAMQVLRDNGYQALDPETFEGIDLHSTARVQNVLLVPPGKVDLVRQWR